MMLRYLMQASDKMRRNCEQDAQDEQDACLVEFILSILPILFGSLVTVLFRSNR